MKKVIAFGTFDHFHLGHHSYLTQARHLGDYLLVIVARDATVSHVKGKMADENEKGRLAGVKKSEIADKVILGEKGDKYEVIRKFRPDFIALGYDQFTFTFRLEKFLIDEGLNTKIVRLEAYRPDLYKTSLIRTKKLAGTPVPSL